MYRGNPAPSRRALSLVLCLFLLLPLLPSAYADEDVTTSEPTPAEVQYYNRPYSVVFKQDATRASAQEALYAALLQDLASLKAVKTELTAPLPPTLTAGGTAQVRVEYEDKNYELISCPYTVAAPEGFAFRDELDGLTATSTQNANANALLAYVNSKLTLVGTGSNYETALGSTAYSAPAFTWTMADRAYTAPGGVTYTFTSEFQTHALQRKVVVSAVTRRSPDVEIDYDTNTLYGVDATVSYSLDRTKWTACKEGMVVPAAWYGKTVYFYYPATAFYEASGQSYLDVPEKSTAPTQALKLSATFHSVTVLNCWDYDNCEYSIDGKNWESTTKSTLTFTGLSPNTSYKVQVRTQGSDGRRLASDAKTSSIKTGQAAETKVDINYGTDKGSAWVIAKATAAPDVSGTRIIGTLERDHLTRFDNIATGYGTDYDNVDCRLTVEQFAGDDNITSFRFSLPVSPLRQAARRAGLEMEYHCDLMRIRFENSSLRYYVNNDSSGTLRIEVSRVTSAPSASRLSWVKSEFDSDSPVYRVNIKNGTYGKTELHYSIPYELGRDEAVTGLEVHAVTDNGDRTTLSSQYNTATGRIEFYSDVEGYLVITSSGAGLLMPFTDVPRTHWAYDFVRHGYNRGLFAGVSPTRFGPDALVERGMIFTLLAKLDRFDVDTPVTASKFTDVKTTDWYAPAAHWALTAKLVSGSTFNPNGRMNREEIAVALYAFLRYKGMDGKTQTKMDTLYSDCSKLSSASQTAICYLKDLGIMDGTSATTFTPGGNVTRAQLAVILSKLDTLLS